MKSSVISTWDELSLLEGEWNELLHRSAAASIFLTWEWIACWRKVLTEPVEPFVIVVRDDAGQLVGIAPYYVSSLRFMKLLSYRTLRFLGDTASGAEYPDWIIDSHLAPEVCKRIAEVLYEEGGTWDTLWMPRMSEWSGAPDRVVSAMRTMGCRVHTRSTDFSAMQLPESLESYEMSFSAKSRQQMRRNKRRVDALRGIEYVECHSSQDLSEFLDALFDLHQRRWNAVGRDGVFVRKPELARRFYEEFAPIAFERGWLAIHAVKTHGEWRAIQYGYLFNNEYSQLQEGFDPEFQQGIGNALRLHMIGQLIGSGVESYDFLGDWTEHKRRWGAERRQGLDVFASSGRPKVAPLFVREFWPTGRFIDEQ